MRKFWVAVLLALNLLSSPSFAANGFTKDEVRNFFDLYVRLESNYDIRLLELYDDNARISLYRKYPRGFSRQMELDGKSLKKLIKESMPLAKARKDKNTYDKIDIVTAGHAARITARKYSVLKCYYDDYYFMELKKSESGSIKIVKERTTSQPQSSCLK